MLCQSAANFEIANNEIVWLKCYPKINNSQNTIFLYVLVISGEYVSEFKDKKSANNEGNLYFKVNIKGF